MARTRRNNTPPPLRFDKKLILNQWLLHLFECESFEKLAEDLKDTALETLDENNISRFHQAIVTRLFNLAELPPDVCGFRKFWPPLFRKLWPLLGL